MNREFWKATKQQTDITAGLLLFYFSSCSKPLNSSE